MIYPQVPYLSQQGNGVYNDCGIACALMLGRWVGVGLEDSIAGWAKVIDPAQDGTTVNDIQKMFLRMGLTPVMGATVDYPRMELVSYQKLKIKNPLYASRSFLHWIVRLEDTRYHDPLWSGTGGEYLWTERSVLDGANVGTSNNIGILENPTMSEDARIPYERVYNYIHSSATPQQIQTVFDSIKQTRQTVGFSADDAGIGNGLKSKTAVLHFVPQNERGAFSDFFRLYYPSTIVMFSDSSPPIQPSNGITFATHLGVSVLIDAESGWECLRRGCKSVLFLNNNGAAIDSARQYPQAKTFMRVWWGSRLTPTQMANALDSHRTDIPSNCYSTILNECDTWCYGTPEEIRERFNIEKQTAEVIWATSPSRVVCIGQFSHGTPDITRPDIVAAWRETYGNFAIANKSRVRVGWHLYTKGKRFTHHPVADSPIYDPVWFEGRDNDMWLKASMPKDVLCVCDETGVEAGAGGFNWAGYTSTQFVEWCYWWLDYQKLKTVQHDAMMIFQLGDHPNWGGYDISHFLDTLTGLWQGSTPRPANMPSPSGGGARVLPSFNISPRKDMFRGD